MSKNQLHGKRIEDWIKSAFPGASDHERDADSMWDIESDFDKEKKLPTSIKSNKAKSKQELPTHIELADARRFFSIDEAFRLLVCVYIQSGIVKQVYSLLEYVIDENMLHALYGNLTLQVVQKFHEDIKTFSKGEHVAARSFAQSEKRRIENDYHSLVKLNPKIGNKDNQRRLQCSLPIKHLNTIVAPVIYSGNDVYRDIIVLPGSVKSTERFSD